MAEYPYFKDIHEDVRQIARGVAAEFKKTAAEADENSDYSIVERNLKRLGELNLLGLHIPKEFGGQGLDLISYMVALEEIEKACGGTGMSYDAQTLAIDSINEAGSDEQRKKYLPLLCKDKISAFGLSEPGAGSDSAALKTTARLEGDQYVINGSKHFITDAAIADIIIVYAVTDPEKKAHGISSFIVPKDTPGLKIGKVEKKMGVKASPTTEFFMDNCRVPRENILGTEGNGFIAAMKTLDIGRLAIGAQCVGLSKAALEIAVAYAKEREQFGRTIAKFQAIQFMIADMATKVAAMENLTYHAAWLIQEGKEGGSQAAAMAKLFCSEETLDVTDKAIQILGGVGFTTDYPVERFHRDAKIMTIGEGTSEVQRLVISRAVIGR
ncbi:MAG: acyl-CoA dehydrogenase family protein [Dehalococcoidia bacterium]|nr:acyl-CoA dehydrogenase family protein [Dehalococcoidia bacterium]